MLYTIQYCTFHHLYSSSTLISSLLVHNAQLKSTLYLRYMSVCME